jgi:N-acetylglutamate synthase-like GNAT family acetyltransferase
MNHEIRIEPFEPKYGERVVSLILPIQQREFGIPVTLRDQPDLLDIPNFYQNGVGNFWVAVADDQVVGTISLLDLANNQGALRKMFVQEDFRGTAHGVARRLLETLLEWSTEHQLHEVYLGTTAQFLAAHRFYEKHGFSEISKTMLPAPFPVMSVDSKFYMCRPAQRSR